MVRKPTPGEWRMTLDFVQLNAATRGLEGWPIPKDTGVSSSAESVSTTLPSRTEQSRISSASVLAAKQ
jgi:hypothetical protein